MKPQDTMPAGYDPRPVLVDKSTVALGEASIVLSMGMSIALNTYHDLHGAHSINTGIAISIGVVVPILVAIVSHVGATLKVHWAFQAWIFAIVVAFMYVSATAGTSILKPALQVGPALVISVALDAAALTMLGVLMYAGHQKNALAKWKGREEARAKAALIAETAARYGRGNGEGNARGNGRGNGEGNAIGNGEGNGGGGTPALRQGSTPLALTAGGGNPDGGGTGGPDAPDSDDVLTPFTRRPRQTDDEIRTLAEDLAGRLALIGEELSVAKYRAEYGGKAERVSPIIAEVKAARAAAADGADTAAEGR